jgi:hypothetical protein
MDDPPRPPKTEITKLKLQIPKKDGLLAVNTQAIEE